MLDGGGTVVLASSGSSRGPGSCAIAQRGQRDFLIHHFYDADHRGRPTLAVRPLVWDTDGWPLVGEPLTRPPGTTTRPTLPVGVWSIAVDFGRPTSVTLLLDGTIKPAGRWSGADGSLAFRGPGVAADVRCVLADDGSWFVGRDAEGRQLRGVRSDR
jgi:hypothetical protein